MPEGGEPSHRGMRRNAGCALNAASYARTSFSTREGTRLEVILTRMECQDDNLRKPRNTAVLIPSPLLNLLKWDPRRRSYHRRQGRVVSSCPPTGIGEGYGMSSKLDLLAIAAHPDDAELTCGGPRPKMAPRRDSTRILDPPPGEMGTRGTPQI